MLFFGLLLNALLLTLTQAVPVQVEERDVSASVLSQLSFISQYAKAAYCKNNNQVTVNAAITCRNNTCPQVESAKAVSLVKYENVGYTDSTGFVAVDHTNKLIVTSFRGTRSVRNFIADALIALVDWPICPGCKVYLGIRDSWYNAKPIVLPQLDSAAKKWPSYKIVVTGHSLGASIATVAACDLRVLGYKAVMYNYGSLMIGNVALSNFITAQGSNYRVTNGKDNVPKVPGYLLGYGHVSPEYWLTGNNYLPVKTTDVQICNGAQPSGCNEGTPYDSGDDHLFYFGYVGGCAEDIELI